MFGTTLVKLECQLAPIHRRYGNIREFSPIQESRENFYYDSATEEKWKFANFKLRENSLNQKI